MEEDNDLFITGRNRRLRKIHYVVQWQKQFPRGDEAAGGRVLVQGVELKQYLEHGESRSRNCWSLHVG